MLSIDFVGSNSCLQTNGSELPVFQGYGDGGGQAGGSDRRIHHQHQAIIPSYKFNCCGNITEWGVDLNPDGTNAKFDFILQVWRPSSIVNISGCYSLVDDFISREITVEDNPANERVARVTPSPQNQLQFQIGDVLGFYVESSGARSDSDNGVVVLNDHNHTSELVWHASVNIPVQPSQTGSCPYPVGTNGVLNTSTHAAPVISISMTTYSCSPSTTYLPLSSPTTIASHTDYVHFTQPENGSSTMSTTPVNYLVLGVSVSVIVLVVLVVFTAVIVAVIIGKYKQSSAANTEQASDSNLYDIVYDSPAINSAHSIQLMSNVAYAAHSKTLHALS